MFNSHSQAAQDRFVHLLHPVSSGRFFDIGSHDPISISNTYALEQLGWSGYLFDIDSRWAEPTRQTRTSPFVCTDVSTFDWDAFLVKENLVGEQFDYLSFDVDDASLTTLSRFPFDKISFRICTIEHDSYRFGNERALAMRQILEPAGYRIVCKDVSNGGNIYEDWYVHTSFRPDIPTQICDGLDWASAIQTLQTSFQIPSSDVPDTQ